MTKSQQSSETQIPTVFSLSVLKSYQKLCNFVFLLLSFFKSLKKIVANCKLNKTFEGNWKSTFSYKVFIWYKFITFKFFRQLQLAQEFGEKTSKKSLTKLKGFTCVFIWTVFEISKLESSISILCTTRLNLFVISEFHKFSAKVNF